MQQLESDLDQTQEKLMTANQRLEEKEKALQNAEGNFFTFFSQVKNSEKNVFEITLVIQFLLKRLVFFSRRQLNFGIKNAISY